MLGGFQNSEKDRPPHRGDVIFGIGIVIFSVVMLIESMNGTMLGGLIGSARRPATPLELWSWRALWAVIGIIAGGRSVVTWRELRARR